MKKLLCRLTGLEESQLRPACFAALYIFCILTGYYVIKPLRDDVGLLLGTDFQTKLFVGTLIAMTVVNPIFGYLMNRFSRLTFIRLTYRFFALNILGFIVIFKYLVSTGQMPETGKAVEVAGLAFGVGVAFFIWVSVFNLFATSIFWAFLADLYNSRDSKKLFGFVGAGGTLGQLVGSFLTKTLVDDIGPTNLLFLSVISLEMAVFAMNRLAENYEEPERSPEEEKPNALSGVSDILKSPYLLGICLYLLIYSFTSSFLWFQKQYIVAETLTSRVDRVDFYSTVNLITSSLTLTIQLFLTGRLLPLIGLTAGLSLVPVVTTIGFLVLGFNKGLYILAAVEICRYTCNYGVSRPSREILYTVVSRREKYLSKSFIDTFVYRAGDTIASGAVEAIRAFTASLQAISLVAVPFGLAFIGVAIGLGRAQNRRAEALEVSDA